MKSNQLKRQLLLGVLVLALGVAIWLNWKFGSVQTSPANAEEESPENLGAATLVNTEVSDNTDSKAEGEGTEANAEYFVKARLNRKNSREEAVAVIKDVLNDVKANDDTKKEAVAKSTQIAENIIKEDKIENLIKAKGFPDSVVYIDNDNVNAIISSKGLLPSEVAQIKDIIISQTSVSADNIKISEAK